MIANIVEYFASALLDLLNMDLAYFEASVPITRDIISIIIVVGWALLIGNLVFQAMKSMASGIGFEGEDPRTLFARTVVMMLLLLGSRQICEIGLGLTQNIINLLMVPDVVRIPAVSETSFNMLGDSSWLLTLIVGIVLIFQIVKIFFQIGERYVITMLLTILSPLAFAMGGSKSTMDISKGWVRIFLAPFIPRYGHRTKIPQKCAYIKRSGGVSVLQFRDMRPKRYYAGHQSA